ncbi:MAG: glycosyltransferase, partial [Nitrososphaerota archaeon]
MMSKSIKVSVIIPTYNYQEYISQSIESVLKQTVQDFEIIVVDDGSTDNTRSVVQVYVDKYPQKVRYIYKENGGVASALNVGIQMAQGKYIAWLSADDIFFPTKLEKQLQVFEMYPEVGLCYTDLLVIDGSGRLLKEQRSSYYPNRETRIRELLFKPYINGSTAMFRRECVEKLGGFDEELNYTADLEFWYRILSHYEVY